MTVLLLPREEDTLKLGATLAEHAHVGDVITLSGPLGAGKTVLARGFLTAQLGKVTEITSPTYTLVHVYDTLDPPVWHFDLYRLESSNEIEELGLDEALASGISLIEWPDRAQGWLPKDRLNIDLKIDEASQLRKASLSSGPAWHARIKSVATKMEAS